MRKSAGGMLLAALALGACIPNDGARPEPVVSAAPQVPAAASNTSRTERTQRAQPSVPLGDGVRALPSAPPAWEARPVRADARDVASQSYVVAPGDTLRGIAGRIGAGTEAIARANNLPPPYLIRVGQRLVIPGGRYHQVRDGETGIAIARAYGTDWSQVVTANQLTEPYILRSGQRILIPGASAGPRSVAQRAAAFRLDIDDILTGGEPAIEPGERPVRAVASPARVLPPTKAVAPPTRVAGAFDWPVEGRILKRFGAGGSGERNDGIKIAATRDAPIRAAADGTVAYAGTAVPGLGGVVIVKHGGNLATVYGHASRLLVQRGQAVKRGQEIALAGESGYADRPQLHFEMRQGRTPIDPTRRLPAR